MHQLIIVIFQGTRHPRIGIHPGHETRLVAPGGQTARHVDQDLKIPHDLVPKKGCVIVMQLRVSPKIGELGYGRNLDLRSNFLVPLGFVHPSSELTNVRCPIQVCGGHLGGTGRAPGAFFGDSRTAGIALTVVQAFFGQAASKFWFVAFFLGVAASSIVVVLRTETRLGRSAFGLALALFLLVTFLASVVVVVHQTLFGGSTFHFAAPF
mmetsp:Transcript_10394/g.22925  ORF Transcript_10394/g.22925 Transcript_10394/m.22925 type:complete len:209 (+) Transcript_10394:648-1274(+)